MLSPLRNRAGKRLREPFGKAGLTVGVIALVFAMLGGAYAASGLNSKQKKEVKAIAKGLQGSGPAGAQGPAGANGKDGSNGSNGAKGDSGTNGTNGTNGTDGEPGESPEGHPFTGEEEENGNPPGEPCDLAGGIEYEVNEETNIVCNGAQGAPGPEGSPWTLGGTLPEGQTETGAYAVSTFATEPTLGEFAPKFAYAPISFPIQLPAPLGAANVHFVAGFGGPECSAPDGEPGTSGAPQAVPGNLCVYSTDLGGYTFSKINKVRKGTFNLPGAMKTGADIVFNVTAPGEGFAFGTWALTAFMTPVITEVSPDQGPAAGGTAVTIKGEGFTGASEVQFGSSAATGTITVSPDGKEITGLSAPAGSGEVDVTVTNPAGTSKVVAGDKYTYE